MGILGYAEQVAERLKAESQTPAPVGQVAAAISQADDMEAAYLRDERAGLAEF